METLNFDKKALFSSIARDDNYNEQVIEEAARRYREREPAGRGLESGGHRPDQDKDRARAVLAGDGVGDFAMEAIVRIVGRPVIRVRGNSLLDDDIPTDALRSELERHSDAINEIVQSIGRIELKGHRRLPWVGTGWVIGEDIIATNRHVATEFGRLSGFEFAFLPGIFGRPMEASIDFLREHENAEKAEFKVTEIIHIEPDGGPDLAFLRVTWTDGDAGPRSKLPLAERNIDPEHRIAVIGYPARDTRTDIPDKMDEIFDGIYNIKRFAPGFVINSSDQAGLLTHDCTTLGGNSGSAVVDFETGEVTGLHFAGREEEANFAVMASVISSRLRETLAGTAFPGAAISPINVVTEEKPTLEDLDNRQGYDPHFLGVRVHLLGMSSEMQASVAPVQRREDGELKYTHYSVVMNAERKIAFYAVANIDGQKLHRVPRGTDRWFFDPRIQDDHQIGNELYKNNPLDRGHLVRRLDPAWGLDRDVAELGVEDSFFYTNCAPQHLKLNRHVWLGLEDYVLDNANSHKLRVSVFSGPVFDANDPEHRGVQIPNEFWKVVVMRKTDEGGEPGNLSASGYVLTQKSLVDNLEFVFGEHQSFQVRLDVIEGLTGLDFGGLKNFDPIAKVSVNEAIQAGASERGHRLHSFKDIKF